MLIVTNHQGNANQNHNKTLLHTYQDGYYQQKQKTTRVGKNVEKLEPFCTAGGNEKWCSCFGKQYGGFSKN